MREYINRPNKNHIGHTTIIDLATKLTAFAEIYYAAAHSDNIKSNAAAMNEHKRIWKWLYSYAFPIINERKLTSYPYAIHDMD
ncbi:MAG: hypothetical protein LBL66_08400 [Clostridiales bacterium]|nr:hypothetical protein [Clostridiales bacterium]